MNKYITRGTIVLIRGSGEQASGVGWALAKAGFRVVMTELEHPQMVRWPVCFGTAVVKGCWQVEDLIAHRVHTPSQCEEAWGEGKIPVLVDPELKCLPELSPTVLVDAIMAKRNTGTKMGMAPLTIALGPGFAAAKDVEVVVETNRGHNLGRLIYSGLAEPNTGIPGEVGGVTSERVVYSPISGVFSARKQIGEIVSTGDILGEIDGGDQPALVIANVSGVLRGLLISGTHIDQNVKVGDIDPRSQKDYCFTISEKARTLGTAVLLAILEWNSSHSEHL